MSPWLTDFRFCSETKFCSALFDWRIPKGGSTADRTSAWGTCYAQTLNTIFQWQWAWQAPSFSLSTNKKNKLKTLEPSTYNPIRPRTQTWSDWMNFRRTSRFLSQTCRRGWTAVEDVNSRSRLGQTSWLVHSNTVQWHKLLQSRVSVYGMRRTQIWNASDNFNQINN